MVVVTRVYPLWPSRCLGAAGLSSKEEPLTWSWLLPSTGVGIQLRLAQRQHNQAAGLSVHLPGYVLTKPTPRSAPARTPPFHSSAGKGTDCSVHC